VLREWHGRLFFCDGNSRRGLDTVKKGLDKVSNVRYNKVCSKKGSGSAPHLDAGKVSV
jgi:hypothetical protein